MGPDDRHAEAAERDVDGEHPGDAALAVAEEGDDLLAGEVEVHLERHVPGERDVVLRQLEAEPALQHDVLQPIVGIVPVHGRSFSFERPSFTKDSSRQKGHPEHSGSAMTCATSHAVKTVTRGIGPRKASSSGVKPSPSMFFKARTRKRPNQMPGWCLICSLGIDGFGFLAMPARYQIALIRANPRSRSVLATRRHDMIA